MNNIVKEWNFLKEHKIFGKNVYTTEGKLIGQKNVFDQCLDIDYVMVNPETLEIDDDESKNTKVQVWLECGPWDNEDNMPSHDIELDCYGDTFEEAILELAKLVRKHYGE